MTITREQGQRARCMERKLAAILAADVAGFSRLMETDEEATLETLRGHFKVAHDLVAKHRGRVFGGAGDSLIAEFPSAVEAVECALRIQEALARRNEELPAERRMQLRIGINVGDVMVSEDDLYGDGVNVAARLQTAAPVGGIYISESAYFHVHKSLRATFRDRGAHAVKNIAEPVRVFQVYAPESPEEAARTRHANNRVKLRRHVAGAAAALAVLIAAGGIGAWFFMDVSPGEGAAGDGAQGPADPLTGLTRPTKHFRVDRPADLDDADALTIYQRIRDDMAEGYARSGFEEAAEYLHWRQFNTAPYLSEPHGARYLNNYGSDAALAYGQFEKAGQMPEGAMLAKDSFEVTARGDVVTGPLFLMEKMPEGFNEASRDWRYTMIMPDGKLFGRTGGANSERVEFCVECHRDAGAENDDLFFLPEDYRKRYLHYGGDSVAPPDR